MDSVVWIIVGILLVACIVGNIAALIFWWDTFWKTVFNKDKQL